MSKGTFVKLNRNLQDHWIWTDEPFSKGQAWVDLIMLARWKDEKKLHRDKLVVRKRGEVNCSMRWLAERWQWDRRKVKRFLSLLESDGMITVECTTNDTTITIENYSVYQDRQTADGTTDDTRVVDDSYSGMHSEQTTDGTTDGTTETIENYSTFQGEPTADGTTHGTTHGTTDGTTDGTTHGTHKKKEKKGKEGKEYIYSRATHDIIQHLNERTGSQYKPTTKKTKELIQARMNEGFTVEDFKTVIDKKCVEWMNTEWQEYLRPVTLFGTKFESYLNAPVTKQTTGNKFLDALARGEFRE